MFDACLKPTDINIVKPNVRHCKGNLLCIYFKTDKGQCSVSILHRNPQFTQDE